MSTQYGLKEVADFYFFDTKDDITVHVDSNSVVTVDATTTSSEGTPSTVSAKFKFDTLKVSNLEFTSEEATANGGKG